ncbi:glycosyl hydrolase 53 family protein [Leifsonia xyli]|uniref:glycosyl hydrolase 53 family protein n=1 Tax=Leifsonia xyli TaxID=1575 RepID=UPI003D66C365
MPLADPSIGGGKRTPFRSSLSVSPFTEAMFVKGLRYTDGRRSARSMRELQSLYIAHGSSETYARIATRPQAVDVDAEHGFLQGIERARLARSLGQPFNPELGLWAVYGDISHQPGPDFSAYPQIELPGEWATLTIDQMTAAMTAYGTAVAKQILGTGVDVDVWDLGNEVEFGVAGVAVRSFTESTAYWSYEAPDAVDPAIGRMSAYQLFEMPDRDAWLQQHLWPYVGKIFAAVATGIRKVDRHARFSTHTSTVSLLFPGMVQDFYTAMDAQGFVADEIGVSFYPTNSATVPDQFTSFKALATELRTALGRRVFIAETAYPSGTMSDPYAWNSPVPGYPLTTQGEHDFIRDLVTWGAQNDVLSGIRPWAPDYSIGGWQPMTYFTVSGSTAIAEPALDSIAEGLARSVRPCRAAGPHSCAPRSVAGSTAARSGSTPRRA